MPGFYKKHGGHILSTAIDKYVYVIVKSRPDDWIVLSYSSLERVSKYEIDNIKHTLIRAVLKKIGMIDRGMEIHTIGDISLTNGGLGGSSAYTIGLVNALWLFIKQCPLNKQEIIDIASEIEIDILKKPIGQQDHYACACGGFNQIIFSDSNMLIAIPRRYGDRLEDCLILFEKKRSQDGSDILNKISKDIGKVDVERNLLDIKGYTEKAINALKSDDYEKFGYLLNQAWASKRKLPGVTTPEIDNIYDRAMKYASGGKVCGAGRGGHLLFYYQRENLLTKEGLKTALIDSVGLPHYDVKFDYQGTRIIFNDE